MVKGFYSYFFPSFLLLYIHESYDLYDFLYTKELSEKSLPVLKFSNLLSLFPLSLLCKFHNAI